MSLNILHKKRWNVWNEENKARVRRDEKQHAEAEAKKLEKVEAVEAEARLSALKARCVCACVVCVAPHELLTLLEHVLLTWFAAFRDASISGLSRASKRMPPQR